MAGTWGGRRPGSGRKKSAKVLQHTSVPPSTNYPEAPVEEFDAPDCLSHDERAIWLIQSPHAFRNRTLTRSTALAFERYCKAVVWERCEAASSARGGPNHRGLLKQINTYELQFMLAPCGKPLMELPAVKAEPQSALSKFRK